MKQLPALDILKARWKALAPREQSLVLAMSAVVGVALLRIFPLPVSDDDTATEPEAETAPAGVPAAAISTK